MGQSSSDRYFWCGLLKLVICGSFIGTGSFLRADFTGGQRVPGTQYTFAPPIFSGGLYNNGGQFQPSDPFFNFFPITAEPVPGAPNLLGVARQFGGVDLVDVHTGSTTKLLQLPVAPYPYF